MPHLLVIKSSLNLKSKSDQFANQAIELLEKQAKVTFDVVDLKQVDLPMCDGGACYGAKGLSDYKALLEKSDGVFIAAPIYNYDVNAALKNFIELTGQAWKENVVAMAFYAGGERSFMSALSLINSMMLDFRCLVLPNYVYASDHSMQSDEDKKNIEQRLNNLVDKLVSLSEWKNKNSD